MKAVQATLQNTRLGHEKRFTRKNAVDRNTSSKLLRIMISWAPGPVI